MYRKVKEFHKNLQIEGEFNASLGWMTWFKHLYGIREITIQGEKLSANKDAADAFSIEISFFIEEEGFLPQQMYNADETGLHWKGLPKSLFNLMNRGTCSWI